jgi:hypothetical protein
MLDAATDDPSAARAPEPSSDDSLLALGVADGGVNGGPPPSPEPGGALPGW